MLALFSCPEVVRPGKSLAFCALRLKVKLLPYQGFLRETYQCSDQHSMVRNGFNVRQVAECTERQHEQALRLVFQVSVTLIIVTDCDD